MMRYVKLSLNAITPNRASSLAAGFDLYSAYHYTVPAKGKILIKTDIAIELPPNCYGRVAPRSGLAWNHFIDVGAGVIDANFRGNICVLLFNFSDRDFIVSPGDRIAQLIVERIEYPCLVEAKITGNSSWFLRRKILRRIHNCFCMFL